jgi:hypothetical protein
MKKNFELSYNEYDEESNPNEEFIDYPVDLDVRTSFTFDDGATWEPILYQFCKFLESVGYVGVIGRVYTEGFTGHFKHPNAYKGGFDDWSKEAFVSDKDEDDENTSS